MNANAWKTYALEELLELNESGTWGETGDVNDFPVLRSTNIQNNKLVLNDVAYRKFKKDPSKYVLKDGDILVTKSSGSKHLIGKCCIFHVSSNDKKRYLFSNFTQRLRTNNLILSKFLFYFLISPQGRKNLDQINETTSGLRNINMKEYLKQKIPVPPIEIQVKIISVFDKMVEIKEKHQNSLDKTFEFTSSLFVKIFGDPTTNPKKWKVDKAKNHIDLLTGYPFKSKEYTDDKTEIRLCGGLIIMPHGIEWSKANHWKKSLTKDLDRFWLNVEDIVIAMDRPWISSGFKIYQIKEEDTPSLLVQRTARIRGKNINQDFLFGLFKSKSFERHARPTETTVPHISPKDIQEFKIILPPIELQNKFSKIIKSIEFVRKYQKQSIMNIDNLFNDLAHKAFLEVDM